MNWQRLLTPSFAAKSFHVPHCDSNSIPSQRTSTAPQTWPLWTPRKGPIMWQPRRIPSSEATLTFTLSMKIASGAPSARAKCR
jgi:hypothetical protein